MVGVVIEIIEEAGTAAMWGVGALISLTRARDHHTCFLPKLFNIVP